MSAPAPPIAPALDLLRKRGEERISESNAPILLEDPDEVWMVLSGHVDVFAVPVVDGRARGPRDFFFRVDPGGALFGMRPEWAGAAGLLAVGETDTRVLRLPLRELRAFADEQPDAVCALVDRYVQDFTRAVAERGTPRADLLVQPGQRGSAPRGADIGTQEGTAWLELDLGVLLFDGFRALPIRAEDGAFPLAAGGWVTALTPVEIEVVSSRAVLDSGRLWTALDNFRRIGLEWTALVVERAREASRAQVEARLEADEGARLDAVAALASVLARAPKPGPSDADDELVRAMGAVGAAMGIEFRAPPGGLSGERDILSAVQTVANNSAVALREVSLQDRWWEGDHGPLLGFVRETADEGQAEDWDRVPDILPRGVNAPPDPQAASGEPAARAQERLVPIALLPTGPGSYEAVHADTGARISVDAALGQALEPRAVQFYRPLPAGTVGPLDLWRFVTRGVVRDVRTVLLMGAIGAALGLLTPLLNGYLFDTVIPAANRAGLVNVFVALGVATLSSAAFQLTRSFAALRIRVRVGAALQMAIVDRLVRLPLAFYRQFTAGDLAARASGIRAIGAQLGGATISAILGSFVSGTAFLLLFYYSVPLALLATALLAVSATTSFVTSRLALRYAREAQEAGGRLSGLVLQLLAGITKLRVSGSEARAFGQWAEAYRHQRSVTFRFGLFQNGVSVFNAVLSIASTLALFGFYALLATDPERGLTTGEFIAFNTAFGMFMGAAMDLSQTAVGLLNLLPTWERARPILRTAPEVDPSRPAPGRLTGRIEVRDVSFAYMKGGPRILSDVTIEAEPGQFIAIVGPSGAGKSTLLRILLGFETPDSGSVFYDRHDLETVDVAAVRRQIGVVLQSAALTQGDIYTNIAGSGRFTMQEAVEALRLAGLEAEVRAMPMGLHTVVPEGGGTLSGGQRQRLLIARALVNRPRILLFDEATSALDNRSQQTVAESIANLNATRIVIAHRLSTIRDADRIYVLDQGRVVQSGTFEELSSRPGLFARLVNRQEA